MTRMACPGMAEEAYFSSALFERSLTFEVANLELILTNREGGKVVFQKVD
jgi:heat shock protein HslJ